MEPHRFILRNTAIRDHAVSTLMRVPIDESRPMEVTIKEFSSSRSLAQNNLFHKWMTFISSQHAEATGKFVEPRVWKLYFKRMFLGEEHHEVNGEAWDETRHTSDLKVREMSEFMNQVDHFCGSEFHMALPHPQDEWREAMGIKGDARLR